MNNGNSAKYMNTMGKDNYLKYFDTFNDACEYSPIKRSPYVCQTKGGKFYVWQYGENRIPMYLCEDLVWRYQ